MNSSRRSIYHDETNAAHYGGENTAGVPARAILPPPKKRVGVFNTAECERVAPREPLQLLINLLLLPLALARIHAHPMDRGGDEHKKPSIK